MLRGPRSEAQGHMSLKQRPWWAWGRQEVSAQRKEADKEAAAHPCLSWLLFLLLLH